MSQSRCEFCGNRVKNTRERACFQEQLLHTMCMKQILSGLANEFIDNGVLVVESWNDVVVTEPDGTKWA